MTARVIPGIHDVTAIAGKPRRNPDFYTQVLGLRLVNKTVNFDDPGTHHLHFVDATGMPGFTRDETVEELGTRLKPPPWIEPQRAEVERKLPKITVASGSLAVGNSEVGS